MCAASTASELQEDAAPAFLAGGGEVGERLRTLDFAQSPLGPPAGWPQSLKTAVRIMLDSRYAMWMLWGPELTFFCNDAYLPTVGLKRNWVLGTGADKVWEEIWPEIGPRIRHVLQTGQATWDEGLLLFLERSGYTEESYHTFSYSPLYDDGGLVKGMLCVVTEVTERVISERRLAFLGRLGSAIAGASSEADMGDALCSSIGGCVADLPFAAIYLVDSGSPGRARRVALSGLGSPQALLPETLALEDGLWPIRTLAVKGGAVTVDGLDFPDVAAPIGPWQLPPRKARLVPLARQGQAGAAGFLIVGLNPFRRFDAPYSHFLDLAAAQLAGGFAAVHAWEAERRRAEALAELDRAKTDFFANVSHEFRTPLTLMIGPLEELLAGSAAQSDPALLEPLSLAHGNSLRLLKLVNTLLDFSRLEAKRTSAHFEDLNLAALTADLASVFRAAIERAGLRYTVDCPMADETVSVDRDMWEKIVLNLLSNAFKYTLQGSISLSLRVSDTDAVLKVRDTGTGIAPAALPHLFERFYRITDTQARTHEGTGIGLSLVNELVKLHGGRIEVDSAVGQGSEFRVIIPVRHDAQRTQAALAAVPLAGSAEVYVEEARRWLPRAAAEEHCDSPGSGAPAREALIVLADDNVDMRNYLARLLGQRYTVIGAGDGQEALAALRREQPDLLLTDVMMPRMDGFALLRAVRTDPLLREIPVILLSARAGEEARIEGLDVGADDYLIKPFSARELLARVGTHLSMARLRREANRRKDEFLATLAHELRNPLAPIRHALAVAGTQHAAPEQVRRSHAIIERQLRHMTLLLDDLLDVSRIAGGRLQLRRHPVDIRKVIDAALETSLPAISAREHSLKVDIEQAPLPLEADVMRLAQAVSNLLNNAAKYTPRGGHLRLDVHRHGQHAVVRVADDGIGISSETLPTIFDMFVQGSTALDGAEGGLGIGLALVKGVVELHGGTVMANSDGIGKGADFVVRLPLSEHAVAATLPATGGLAPPLAATSRRILVADDNRDAVETLQMLLQLDGHDVRVAYDGEQALELAAQFAPQIALLDIGMPKRNGYDAARALRERFAPQRMTLVAVTGWGQNSDRARALAAGFDHHLTKPVDPTVLQQLLQSLPPADGATAPSAPAG